MCGIFGIQKFKNSAITDDDISVATSMLSLLKHRGPDEQNIVQVNDNLLLGQTRLSINDILGGSQPFKNKENSFLVANGEIYSYKKLLKNRPWLRTELNTSSDCEVLLPLMQHCGTDALKEIQGMFSLAFFDNIKKRLYLARDVFGEKPLYYHVTEEQIIFSSEFRALFKSLNLNINDINEDFFYEFMLLGYPIIKGNSGVIRQVSRGCLLEIDMENGECIESKIDFLKADSGDNILSSLDDYMISTTQSEVPICMGLSGGLDSTLVMTKLHKHITTAYTIGYEESGGSDEIAEARSIANHFGIEHKAELIKNDEVGDLFKEQAVAKDLPINDIAGIGYLKLYKSMNRDNYKVCFMGHGGDEIFMGYPWLNKSFQISRIQKAPILYETLHDFRVYRKLCKNIFTNDMSKFYWESYDLNQCSEHIYENMLSNVSDYWLEPNSLKMADSLSMSVSVESRQPLLCWNIIDLVKNSLDDHHDSEGKAVLKTILRDTIPSRLIQKNKKYFAPPYMKYYSIIHQKINAECANNKSYTLKELNIFNQSILDEVIYGEKFQHSPLSYYLFPRFATLHYWLKALTS